MAPPIHAAIAIALVVWVCWNRIRKLKHYNLPAGPPGLPLVGNIFDMPSDNEWVKYKEWADQYESDTICLKMMGMTVVVVHSLEVAIDLLEKRSSIYSDRPRAVMLTELMGWWEHFGFAPYGKFWRKSRRMFHQEFRHDAVKNLHPEQLKARDELLRRLLDTPERWMEHLRHQAGSTMLDIIYGIEALPENDPYIAIAERAVASLTSAAIPGAFLVDTFPLLKHIPEWIPGAGFQKKAKAWKKVHKDLVHEPYKASKQAIAQGTAKPCYCSRRLQNVHETMDPDAEELLIKQTASAVYVAGTDTTVSALGTFFLAMVQNPEVQARAQAELDNVIGKDNLPTLGDEKSLPYIMAIVKECLRWKAIAPVAVPHRLLVDDEYNGYTLPGGTIVVPNTWAITHDEKVYPDPFTFKPERFLKDGQLDPSVQSPELAVFGFGRRICPGRHMAFEVVWLTVASVLASFNIQKALDSDGAYIEPSGRYINGLVCLPEPFVCKITTRSKKVENLLRATAHNSREEPEYFTQLQR